MFSFSYLFEDNEKSNKEILLQDQLSKLIEENKRF